MPTETTQPGVNGVALSPLDVLTLAQAAAYLQLPEDAVRAEAEAGRLPGRAVGGQWRFVRDAIVGWLRTGGPKKYRPENHPVSNETPEEYEAFLATIRAHRDETDRLTGSGKYAPEG
ncbi:MAG: helix-turn-helix domain-containing protein [Gemmataceae bacterium]|nr:helix-turn-helix domain-containing protein [Gemmataceae bacterium]